MRINLFAKSSIILFGTLLFSCSRNDNPIPKPPTYLRLDLPNFEYVQFEDDCPYTFETSSLFKVKPVENQGCHKDIDLGPLNGVIHFSYIPMSETLSKYVNFANDKVDEHKIKATSILDSQFINPETRVFGTFFELKGDVASPFQFYLTDSTSHFVSAVVYFNSSPNYDSLKPSLDHLKKDLYQMINTFHWQ
jgi:gliding motility-associated lipoprotein GldD